MTPLCTRRSDVWVVLATLCCGCATQPQYGSFLPTGSGAHPPLAADAATKLSADYPDAVFALGKSPDRFGRSLGDALRSAGHKVQTGGPGDSAGQAGAPGGSTGGSPVAVRYIVDPIKDTQLLRVVLRIDRRSISRAYAQQADRIVAAGPWASSEPAPARASLETGDE